MDGDQGHDHHHPHAAQHQHGLGGFHNAGFSGNDFDSYYTDQTTGHGFDNSWAFTQPETSIPPSTLPVAAQNNDWHLKPHAFLNQSVDSYAQPFAASEAPQTASPSPYQSYSGVDHARGTAAFDPALTSHDGEQFYNTSTAYSHQQQPQQLSKEHLHFTNNTNQTVAPNAIHTHQYGPNGQETPRSQPPVSQSTLLASVPAGKPFGAFTVVDAEELSQSTSSERLSIFLNIGLQDFEFPINKTGIPPAPARKSKNELRKLAANDPKLAAKIRRSSSHRASASSTTRALSKPKVVPASSQLPKGIKAEAESSSDESSSEYDSSDDDSDDEPSLPNPLPAKRSEDNPKDAVRYDTLKALWRSRRSALPLAEIRTGLKDFWEIVRIIRDRWKQDTAAVKLAEEKGNAGELPLLKSRVRDQREMIEVAFSAAVQHGHRSILEVSSENVPFLFLCYQFLQDRYAQDDVNGVLARAVLNIVAMCITLSEDKINKTHLVKVLPRYAKKGNPEVQALARKIEAAAKEGTKKEAGEDKTPKPESETKPASPTTQSPPPSKSVPAGSAGIKRAAPGVPGAATQPAAKRVANGTSTSSEPIMTTSKGANGTVKKAVTAAGSKAPSAVKTKTTVSKPSTFFNAMQSTTKKAAAATKPAVSSVVAAALKSVDKKPAAVPAAESASKSSFSFADTMANLTKPKENVPAPKIQQEVPHETEEQKRKRLRKESRRSLRVTFKPDKSLVQIRYFTHDPNEEIGHDINMTRDAGDVGGEGRMFKQHKDQMDLDDDEDDVGEEDVRPYQAPSLINFDDVDPEERQRNFAPYGGGHTEPDSAERSIREQYEANTLMVFYTDPSDVPSTPKEPTGDTDSSDAAELREFGEPEARTLDRIPKSKTTGAAAVQGNQSSATPNIDIASLLAALKPQIQQNSAVPVATTQQQPPNPGFNSLQSLLASLNQPQSAAPAVPVQQQPSAAVPNVANILANLQAAPQPQYQQPPPSAPSQMNPALAAILANLQHNGASAPSATPTSSATMPPAFALPYTPSPSAAVQPAQQQGFQQGTQRHSSHQQQQQYGMPQQQPPQQQQQQQQQQQSWGSGYGSDKRFTQTCKYWALGRCQKGANCTYKHY